MNVGIEVSELQNVNAALCQIIADSIDISFGLFIHLNLGFVSNNILNDNTKCQWKSCPYHNNGMYKYYYNFKKSIYLIRSRSVLVDVVNHEI